mmetsp:Transcript_9774/g.16160  ORF Transcript_9774/g.16160 Transcript_9774/m.16160 type:complete len:154 (+) Transcript_9774:217-678(+)
MTDDLVADFPRQLNLRRVHFAESSHLHIYKRHNVARHELWFTTTDYDLMKLEVQEDVLRVRAGRASNETAVADDDAETSGLWIGITHLLTQACIDEVRACRARCIRAVLSEQARQGPSAGFNSCEAIALASSAQTEHPVLRARILGKLNRDAL